MSDSTPRVFYGVFRIDPNGGGKTGPWGGVATNDLIGPDAAKKAADRLGADLFGDDAIVEPANPEGIPARRCWPTAT
jgi:hypothetical protein